MRSCYYIFPLSQWLISLWIDAKYISFIVNILIVTVQQLWDDNAIKMSLEGGYKSISKLISYQLINIFWTPIGDVITQFAISH